MEIKENYITVINDLENTNTINYDNLTLNNIITKDDVNSLKNSINLCIDKLSGICSDQFCQLCQNGNYIQTLINKQYKRVKKFNDTTDSITAVFADSMINGIQLSSNTSINLLTYDQKKGYSLVKTLNNQTGNLSGIQTIIINGNRYSYSEVNEGIVNLGYFKNFSVPILKTINGVSGKLNLPQGVVYQTTDIFREETCDSLGTVYLSSFFNMTLTVKDTEFKNLYIENTSNTSNSAVINLKFLNDNTLVCNSHIIHNSITSTKINGIFDNNVLTFLYAIQNEEYKNIIGFVPGTIDTQTNGRSYELKFSEQISDGDVQVFYLKKGK